MNFLQMHFKAAAAWLETGRQVGRQKAPFNPDTAASLQLHAQLASACLHRLVL